MTHLYREDLAYIQKCGFGDFARQATSEIISLLRADGIAGGRLIDVGCGAGESTRLFADAGFEVLGIEPSPALLAFAREQAPGARFLPPTDAYQVALPAADVIVVLGEPLNYHERWIDADARIRSFFANAAAALRPGGRLLFDIIVDGRPTLDSRGWRSGDDWAILFESIEDTAHGWLTRHIESFRKLGGMYRRTCESHDVRVFQRDQVRSWLQDAGFAVTEATAYGSYSLGSRRVAYHARRLE